MRLMLIPALCLAFVGCGIIDSVSGPKSLSIKKFEASPDEVSPGSSVTLSWDVEGAEQVAIQGIGSVPSQGSRTFPTYATATYTLTARAGTSSATSSVIVSVRGSGSDPFANPVPNPSPSASPSPAPTPEPTPSPNPNPTPEPGPAGSCGAESATSVKGCTVTWEFPKPLPEGQCIALNAVTLDLPCPVVGGTQRSIGFAITAKTALNSLSWRSAPSNSDTVSPLQGSLDVNGKTNVLVSDKVGGEAVIFEVVDDNGGTRLRFRIKHKE